MRLRNRIRQLSISQLWKFSWLFLKHPLLIIPTIRATKNTFAVCNMYFKGAHHGNNAANAFRHVLWNLFMCQNSLKQTKNKQKSVFWAQKVSDLYEKVTKNNSLNKAMDLHNNAAGRIYFLNLLDKKEQETINFVLRKMENSLKVTKIEEMEKHRSEMVFIEG